MSQLVHSRVPRPAPNAETLAQSEAAEAAAELQVGEEISPVDALDGTTKLAGADLLGPLWRFFISRRTGLGLILALGAFSLAGTLLAQAPNELRGDAAGYSAWVEGLGGRYGGWTSVLSTLGMFQVFDSLWFKATLVLLTTSIMACSVHRTPFLYRKATQPRLTMHDGFFSRAPLHEDVLAETTPEQSLDAARSALKAQRFRIIETREDAALHLFADKNRWAPFGSVVAHVAFVVILLGAFLTASTGFKNTQFIAPVGGRAEVGHGSGLSVEARSFSDTYYDSGAPKDYVSDLVLFKNGKQVARQDVRVNQPLSYGGVTLYQSFFGLAAQMKVTDAKGAELFSAPVPMNWTSTDGKHSIGQLNLPDAAAGAPAMVYVVESASGEIDPEIQAGQAQLEVYAKGSDGQPIATQVVDQGKPATIAGLTFTFQRDEQYTGLIVAKDPGANFVWGGSILMIVGLFMVFFFPHRRLWVRISATETGSRVRFASPERRDGGFAARFHALATGSRAALTSAPPAARTPAEAL